MTDTRFVPGPGTGYITDSVLALADASGVDAELLRLCATSTDWETLAEAARERHVVALVAHDAQRVRLAVGGQAEVVVSTAAGERRFDGGDTWTAATVEAVHSVTLASTTTTTMTMITATKPADDDAGYRTDGGIVPAARLSRRLVAPAEAPTDPFELLFGHTVARSVESAAVRTTVTDPVAPRALGVLVFDTGERVVVDRTIVLGRNPTPTVESTDAPRPRLVKLARASVSRRHAVIRLDRWTVSIEDLGSLNGTTVEAGDHRTRLCPGRPFELAARAVVDLGGAVSFVMEEAA